jgi:hypothetical protein
VEGTKQANRRIKQQKDVGPSNVGSWVRGGGWIEEEDTGTKLIGWARLEFSKHGAHAGFVLEIGIPAFDKEGSKFAKGSHLAVLGGHASEIEGRRLDSEVAR